MPCNQMNTMGPEDWAHAKKQARQQQKLNARAAKLLSRLLISMKQRPPKWVLYQGNTKLYSSYDEPEESIRALCEMFHVLSDEEYDRYVRPDQELVEWWERHREEDARRDDYDPESERARIRRSVEDKLGTFSPAEIKLIKEGSLVC